MKFLNMIKNRIYSYYLMHLRLDEYERIIKKLLEEGYEYLSVKDFYRKIKTDDLNKNYKYFINRYDIDTYIKIVKEFFKIEKKYGVKATYYFRLSTLDFNLCKKLGIESESYDDILMKNINIYVSDRPYPVFYYSSSIFNYIRIKNIIYFLSYPRQWQTNILVKTIDNLQRLYEGIKWKI